MTASNWIAICGLLFTICSLLAAQLKANKIAKASEKRLEYKLKLYQILLGERLSISESVARFQQHNPTSKVESVEINKAIYEMLVDGTIVFYDDRTMSADTIDEDDEEDDDDVE